MKYFLLTLFLTFQLAGNAQTVQSPQKPPAQVEKILIQSMFDFTNAWAVSDTATLAKLLTPEYRHSDIFGKIQHKKEWLEFAAGKREIADLKISDVEAVMYPGDIAAITGIMNYLFGAEKTKQSLRFTQLLGRYSGKWKRIMFQATLINQ